MTQEPLKIGDKVEFSFFDKIKTGTISEINGDIYVVDFDESMPFKLIENIDITYHIEPTRVIKASGTAEVFKKK